ncbi:MAG: translocation/assembly module TamB [Spirochaetaceae bacterium]|nr:translocation/assembly module TamB [Spirochaetaceae bacterium]
MGVIAFLINYYLDKRINGFKEAVIASFEKIIDGTITFDTISPSIFQHIEIRRLNIKDAEGQYIFTADRVRINFSLFRMFFSNKNPISMIYLENSSITLNTMSDKNIVDLLVNTMAETANDNDTPRTVDRLSVRGRNISINTTSTLGTFSLNRVFVDLRIDESRVNFMLRTDFAAENIPLRGIGDSLTANIRAEGVMDMLLRKHDYNIAISNLKTNTFNIRRQNFNIQYQDSRITARKVRDRVPIDITVEYYLPYSLISASAKFENYSLSDSNITLNVGNNFSFLFNLRYTGNIELLYFPDSNENKLSYNGYITSSLGSTIFSSNNNFFLSFFGNDNSINFTQLLLETDRGTLSYAGLFDFQTLLPVGTLTLADIQYAPMKNLNSQLVFMQDGANSIRTSIHLEYGNKVINTDELRIQHNNQTYFFQLYLETDEGGTLSYSGSFSYSAGQYMEAALVFEDFGLDYITEFFIPDILNRIRNPVSNYHLNASIKIATNFRTYDIVSDSIRIHDIYNMENYISASLNVDDDYFSISDMVINLRAFNGTGSFTIDKTNPGKYYLDSLLAINNQIYNLSGTIYPGAGLIITGNHNLYFSLFHSDARSVFYLYSERLPLLLPNNTTSYLTLRVNGYSDNNGNYRVVARNNTITGIKTPHAIADISFSCYIVNNRIRITNITYTDVFSRLSGNGDIFIRNNQEVFGWTYISDFANRERYLLSIDIKRGSFLTSVVFDNSLLRRISGPQTVGRFSGEATYKNHRGFPELTVTASTNHALVLDTDFLLDLDLYLSYREILINRLEVKHGTNRITRGRGTINRINRNYRFTSLFISEQAGAANHFESNIILNGELSKTNYTNNLFDISFSQFTSGTLLFSNIDNNILSYDYWTLSFFNTEEYFSMTGGPENAINVYFDRIGTFNISLKQPLPLNGFVIGRINNGNIQATFQNISLDIGAVGRMFGKSFFRPTGGILKGTFSVSGKLMDPDFFGELSIEAFEAVSSFSPLPIEPFNTYVILEGKSISIPNTFVRLQRSRFFFQADAAIDRWIPREFIVILRTSPGENIWIRERFGPIDADGYASGELVIEGDDGIITVSGTITVSRTTITLTDGRDRHEEVAPPPEQDAHGGIIIDLELVSGQGVEFYWPTVRFPILRTSAAVGQRLHIYTDFAARTFALTGNIRILSGEIFYFNQTFFVREGMIDFDENEYHFDPLVTVRAEMRQRTVDHRDVRIFLILESCPLSQFSPRFVSTPHLSEPEIYALLGQGIYHQLGGDDITFGSAILGASSYGSHFIGFLRPFETAVKNFFNLDFFLVRTQFLQRAFLHDIFSPRDLPYIEDQGIGTFLDNTSVFMGKYFGEYFFLHGLLRLSTLDFDRRRYSYYDIPDFMGIYLETDIGLDVDTPLAFISLRFYPQINNFLDSLLDTTLQLSWSFSF